MAFLSNKKNKIIFISLVVAVALIGLLFGGFAIYVSDYYRADDGAIVPISPEENITLTELDDGSLVFEPRSAKVGFIFYPGGKVEHNAYQPLMLELARRGILCALVRMPFNLAVFDKNAADAIREEYSDISRWYVGGHSLGGAMAASHIKGRADEYRGLILLGAYSTADLNGTGLDVLCMYGSEDRVMDLDKYKRCKDNLPFNLAEKVIEGGNHSFFGMYGPQRGDGTPTISNREQIAVTADTVALFAGITLDK